jgi:hypothetical protein
VRKGLVMLHSRRKDLYFEKVLDCLALVVVVMPLLAALTPASMKPRRRDHGGEGEFLKWVEPVGHERKEVQ